MYRRIGALETMANTPDGPWKEEFEQVRFLREENRKLRELVNKRLDALEKNQRVEAEYESSTSSYDWQKIINEQDGQLGIVNKKNHELLAALEKTAVVKVDIDTPTQSPVEIIWCTLCNSRTREPRETVHKDTCLLAEPRKA